MVQTIALYEIPALSTNVQPEKRFNKKDIDKFRVTVKDREINQVAIFNMNESVEIEEKQHGNFILAAAAWQDTLLQAYRGYLLFTQAIFLAVSVGLLTAQVSSQNYIGKLVFFVPNFSVAVLAVVTLTILHKAIIDRSKSVDWWQRSLLRWEKGSDDSRYFTTFRIRKEHSFLGPEIVANQLSNDQIESLLRPEKPKARQVFGIFMPGFLILWIIVGGCAGFDLLFELLTS